MFAAIVLFLLAIVLAFATIGIYNRLIGLKNGARMTWSNVGVLLKQRHDELPKLVEICLKHYEAMWPVGKWLLDEVWQG